MKLLLVTLLLWCATPADEECALLAPNIITANCDGVNCFKITTNCAFEEYTLTVYNRWGVKMAEVEADDLDMINKFANGLLTDDKYPGGSYLFSAKANGYSGSVEKKWMVNLIK